MKRRFPYILLVLCVQVAGLLSRQLHFVPDGTGDMLYALMMFFIVRVIWLRWGPWKTGLVALGICYAIECSQLYHAEWIDALRATLPGRLVLGQGFLWSDLFAYFLGALLGAIGDRKLTWRHGPAPAVGA